MCVVCVCRCVIGVNNARHTKNTWTSVRATSACSSAAAMPKPVQDGPVLTGKLAPPSAGSVSAHKDEEPRPKTAVAENQ